MSSGKIGKLSYNPWRAGDTSSSPNAARSWTLRLEFHDTPTHGSWLNMVESELAVLSRQGWDQRIPTQALLQSETAAWEADRNQRRVKVNWHFKTFDARIRLKRVELEHVDALIKQAERELDDNLSLMKGLKPDSHRYKKLDPEGKQIEGQLTELFKRKREIEAALVAHVLTDNEISDPVQFGADAELGLANPTEADKPHWL